MSTNVCICGLPELNAQTLPGFVVVASPTDSQELFNALSTLSAHAVVLNLDERNIIGTIVRIAEVRPQVAIVGVTGVESMQRVIHAQRAGCRQVVARPIDPDDLVNALHRALGREGMGPTLNRIFAVLGSSGGTGTTTVAAHLALEIAQLTDEPTALFDLDLEWGGIADVFNISPPRTLADIGHASTVDGALLERTALVVEPGVHVFARPPTIQAAHAADDSAIRSSLEAARRAYPYTVLDLSRSLSPLMEAAIEMCSRLLVVIQLTFASIKNAVRIVEESKLPDARLGVGVNRYRKEVGTCTIRTAAEMLGRPPLTVIPSDFKSVEAAFESGKPLGPKNPVRAAISELAAQLIGCRKAAHRATWLEKLGVG